MADFKKIPPLDWQTPVVDPSTGFPSSQFLRLWQEMFQNGAFTQGEVEDKADKSTLINTGTGLSGGGDLSADRTIVLDADLDDLNDVDVSTTPPTDGQALVWDNTAGLWVPGAGGAGLQKIAEFTAAGGETSCSFSSIPQTYSDLILITNIRCNNAVFEQFSGARFNGDSGANYNDQRIGAANTSLFGGGTVGKTYAWIGQVAGNSAPANAAGISTTEIINYRSAFQKSWITTTSRVLDSTVGNFLIDTITGKWANTAAISSIQVILQAGAFAAGSKITLYGRG